MFILCLIYKKYLQHQKQVVQLYFFIVLAVIGLILGGIYAWLKDTNPSCQTLPKSEQVRLGWQKQVMSGQMVKTK